MRLKETFFLALVLISAVFFSGCGMKNLTVNYVPEDADKFAQNYLNMLKKGDIDGVLGVTSSDILSDKARDQFLSVSKTLDKGELKGAEVVKFHKMTGYFSKNTKVLIDYQLEFERGWAEAIIVVEKKDGVFKTSGLYVDSLPKSLREIHSDGFYAKPIQQYLLASLALIVPLFIFYSILQCLTMPIKYKVLWVVFIMIGLARFSLIWTSGQIAFYPFTLVFFGAEAVKDGIYGPWVFSFSFPLGAVAFHAYNRMIGRSGVKQGAVGPGEGE